MDMVKYYDNNGVELHEHHLESYHSIVWSNYND